MQLTQLSDFLFAAASEAGFLELQIANLFFVGDEGVRVDQMRAGVRFVLTEHFSEFQSAFREKSRFEGRDAAKTPVGIGDRLHEIRFEKTRGREFFDIGSEVTLVFSDVVSGQQNSAPSQSGFDGVN